MSGSAEQARGWTAFRGRAKNVSTKVMPTANGTPSLLSEVRFLVDAQPVVARVAHDYIEVKSGDEIIVVGRVQDAELAVNYWWNCSKAKGHVPSPNQLKWSIVAMVFLSLVALTAIGTGLWREHPTTVSVTLVLLLATLGIFQDALAKRKVLALIEELKLQAK